jgi:hypothetical protein
MVEPTTPVDPSGPAEALDWGAGDAGAGHRTDAAATAPPLLAVVGHVVGDVGSLERLLEEVGELGPTWVALDGSSQYRLPPRG